MDFQQFTLQRGLLVCHWQHLTFCGTSHRGIGHRAIFRDGQVRPRGGCGWRKRNEKKTSGTTGMSMELSNYLVSWVVTYLGDLQPTYIRVIIYLLSSMDILVHPGNLTVRP